MATLTATIGTAVAQVPPTTLPEVQVTAPRDISTRTEDTGEYTSPALTLGTKTPQSLKNTPQSVSVITQQRIRDQNLTSLDAALAQSTGITVNNTLNRASSLYSRGFLINTVQLDGVPMALPTSNYGYETPDLVIYDHVEVLRGSAGLLNGAGTPGAVIGLTRKRGTAQKQFQVNTSLGSWSNKRLELDAAGPLNEEGTLRGRGIFMHENRKFFYDVAKQERTLLYGVLDYDLTPKTRLSIGASHQELSGIPIDGTALPRYSNGADLQLPRSTFLGASWNTEKTHNTEIFAEAEHRFDDDWKLKLSATQMLSKTDSKIGYLLGTIDPQTGTGALQRGEAVNAEVERKGIDAFLSGSFEALGQRQEAVIGANFSEHRYESELVALYSRPFSPVDIFHYNPYAVPEPVTPASTNGASQQRTLQNGVYGTLRLKFSDPATLVLGARNSHWKFKQSNVLTGSVSSEYSDSAVTPFMGLIYSINRNWSAYASYADVFTVQNAFGIDGKRLDPVTGANYEAGLKGELLDGKLNTSFAVFHIKRKNIAEFDTLNTGPRDCNDSYCYIAGGETESRGFEAEIAGRVARGWNVFAGYTYNKTQYVRDRTATGAASSNEGQPLASWVPKHIFRVWTAYQMPGDFSRWTIGAGVNAQSKFYRDLGGTRIEQRGLATFNARVGYQINNQWSAAVNVNNIFDKTYYSRINLLDQGSTYGEPRSVTISLRGSF